LQFHWQAFELSLFIKMQLSGVRRLRDAIVLGYQLRRVPGSDVAVPDWYSLSEKEIGVRAKTPTDDTGETHFYAEP
jgi:L-arabinokinase